MNKPILESRKAGKWIQHICVQCKAHIEYELPEQPWTIGTQVKCALCDALNTVPKPREAARYDPRKSNRIGTDDRPIDMEYYELLGVDHKAPLEQIRKEYRKLAIKYHPDKNSDPEAEDKFKKISEAYQVLSDPALRRKYNEFGPGKGVTPEGGFVDPEEIFSQLFGGERFLDIIGEISLGKDMKEALQNEGGEGEEEVKPEDMTPEQKKEKESKDAVLQAEREKIRKERVERLTANLSRKLSVYAEGPEDATAERAFRSMNEMEAEDLKTESYGVELLHAIGWVYTQKSKAYLGRGEMLGITGFVHSVRGQYQMISETVSTVRSAIDLKRAFEHIAEEEAKGTLTAEDKAKLEEEAAAKGMEALWKGAKLEVQGVLREVCDNVLADKAAKKDTLRKRAVALGIVGKVFQKVHSEKDEEREYVKIEQAQQA